MFFIVRSDRNNGGKVTSPIKFEPQSILQAVKTTATSFEQLLVLLVLYVSVVLQAAPLFSAFRIRWNTEPELEKINMVTTSADTPICFSVNILI